MPEQTPQTEGEPTLPPPPKAIEVNVLINDPRKMPCFRSAMLYGVSGGFVAAIFARYYNKSWRNADRYGMGAFFLVSIGRWHTCRHFYNEKREQIRGIVTAMEQRQKRLLEKAANEPPKTE